MTLYRQDLSKSLGEYALLSPTAGSTTLLTDTVHLKSSIQSVMRYTDWMIFRPSAALAGDKLRWVATYDPLVGTVAPDRDWTNQPIVGEAVELHGLLEPFNEAPDLINVALKRCFITQETTLTPVALQTRHSLVSIPWIDEAWKVRSVGVLSTGQNRLQIDPYLNRPVRGQVINDGGTWYLDHSGFTFMATDTLYLQTISNAYFTSSTGAGLVAEADTSSVPVDWLTAGALIEFFIRRANILDRTSNQRMAMDQSQAAARFTSLSQKNFQLPPLRFQPMYGLGPLPSYVRSW